MKRRKYTSIDVNEAQRAYLLKILKEAGEDYGVPNPVEREMNDAYDAIQRVLDQWDKYQNDDSIRSFILKDWEQDILFKAMTILGDKIGK